VRKDNSRVSPVSKPYGEENINGRLTTSITKATQDLISFENREKQLHVLFLQGGGKIKTTITYLNFAWDNPTFTI
jgi:hypothetical protein